MATPDRQMNANSRRGTCRTAPALPVTSTMSQAITNTTPVEEKLAACSKLRVHSVASLLGEAIHRIHENSSVSSLFV